MAKAQPSTDLYAVLGVARDATPDQVKRAYRRLSAQLHPDRNKDPAAAARMAEVNQAYEVLSDPEKRAAYDRFGTVENPIEKVAIETLVKKVGEYIDAFDGDIVASVMKWLSDRNQDIERHREMAARDMAKLEKKRKKIRRKDGGDSMFERVFDERIQRAKDALASLGRQEEVIARMREIMLDYESVMDATDNPYDAYRHPTSMGLLGIFGPKRGG